ncbi:hypothetical protein Pla110_22140 [Polystyrenella longa]|uniref:Uncharacterized protein n=1 Tax=Polystyrenella longa TaxID=2528007 RepID=A0A518CMQ7_9PLAN|nr:hypothetical protein [Polystyrenella longa]QDU80484.1 hypothetical protein Pla110_22140 [Polystyrenella longa]
MPVYLPVLLFASILFFMDCTYAACESPFEITTEHTQDNVEVSVAEKSVIISIHSPFGISQSIIERKTEHWPEKVILRLYLKGMEHLKITNEKVVLEAAVSSTDVRLWMNGKEDLPINAQSPYWMDIRKVGKDGKPVSEIPLTDGYFEMELPKAMLKNNPKSITFNWIDFYR